MSMLDPKFAKIVALMNSTQHAGEKQAARARAEAVAMSCGMTFDDAVATMNRPPSSPAAPNIFEGFDDWMEKREPGWKARKAVQRSEKERARLKRRFEILERYGSREAALAPCAKELLIRKALAAWIKPCKRPWQRWTESVDGYTHFLHEMPDRVRDAVARAYSLPMTFGEAKIEFDYWITRRDEIEDVLGPDNYGDDGLDLVCRIRADMVRDLVEKDIVVRSLADLYARFAMYRSLQSHDQRIEDALFRDLEVMAMPKEHLSNPSTIEKDTHTVRTCDPSASVHDDPIADMLRADPGRSDRDIARAANCSPTTVGKVRRHLGLSQRARSVQRGGRIYTMRTTSAPRRPHFHG